MTDPTSLIAQVRDHYVKQFAAFAEEQKENWSVSATELALRLGGESSDIYEKLWRMDFVYTKANGKIQRAEFDLPYFLKFDVISTSFGAASLTIQPLRWHDIDIHHDVSALPQDRIGRWFELWFDPEDKRRHPEAAVNMVIHSMLIRPGRVSVDFGTAPAEAFWEMLKILESAGASALWLSSSTAQAEGEGEPAPV